MPNGWKLGVISDLADTVMGYAFKSADFAKAGIPLLRMGNLYQNTLSLDRNPIYLPESFKNEYERFLVKPNDLVMSMTGTMGKRDYGFTVKIPTDAPFSLLNQRVLKFVPKHESSSDFLLNLLRSEIILSRLYAIPGGTKQANLSAKQIQELPAPIPPLPEQRKIAKILSTWDKAISTTERLIDNSKQQKKALMQQLLTGKKRLLDDSGKPFEGEWEEVLLGNIVDRPICYGVLKPGDHTEGGIPLLRIQDLKGSLLNESQMIRITKELHQEFKRTILREGDLVMSIVGTLGKVLKIPKQLEGANITRAFAVIGIAEHSKDFIKQYLTSDYIQEWLLNTATGNAQKVLNVAAIRKLKINVPAIEEQRKIAIVLGSADKEIELLEQQLADLKLEKKALMQQLLTGKRRVKVDAEAVA